jgi:hypothetical protein
MKHLLALLLATAMGSALAHNCPNEMKAIEAKLAAGTTLSAADTAKVRTLLAQGEAAHKAGNHDESMKLLGEAKKIVGI